MTTAETEEVAVACSRAYEKSVERRRRANPQEFFKMTKNELNNAFFADQDSEIFDPDDHPRPSSAFKGVAAVKKLWALQHRFGVEHAIRSGGARPQVPSDFVRNVMFPWCAAYAHGTGHPPHVHEDSIVSGVFYAKARHGSSPIILSDPRGGGHRATAGMRSKTYMPEPPFHHQYYFFPKAGDLLLFPSFMVHEVPEQLNLELDTFSQSRIVFPFNLYGDLESWSRTNA